MEDKNRREFYYVCPNCGGDVDGCPDPACEGVGHHVSDVTGGDSATCSPFDVKLYDSRNELLVRRYIKGDD